MRLLIPSRRFRRQRVFWSEYSVDDVDTLKTTRVCINKVFSASDYKLVFYDNTLFTTCKNTLSNSVKKVTWDTTIGWMLGFRKLSEYPLGLDNMFYDVETETTYYRTYYRSVFTRRDNGRVGYNWRHYG
jgi:hypothetical protein